MTMSSTAIVDHVSLTVVDLDVAVRWYTRALELTVEFAFQWPEFDLRSVLLLSPTGYRLELLERQGSQPGPPADSPLGPALTRGYGHLCLDVEIVDVAYEEFLAAGAAERMPPRPAPEPGVRMAWVADPEGNLIELVDRAAVRARGGANLLAQPTIG